MKLRRMIIPLFLLTGIVTIVITGAYNYYAPPKLRQPYKIIATPDDTLRIAFIGDSWAFLHKDHNCKIAQMLQDLLHRPIKVHSYGICGLTSKEIYENIFNNTDFRHFFQKRTYQYCFISAGINDTYKKMGTFYYQQSIDGIIQFLLANNIRPIILEIPNYDIQKSFDRQKSSRKLLRHLSMLVNRKSTDCKQQFRNALDELIQEKGYTNQVGVVRYQSWNNNFEQDLGTLYLGDGLHLNDKGYYVLDSTIAEAIVSL